ncbi:phospholipase D-like domain-containing protein [Cellulomonas sp. Root137]|uniref:phospholipase D-like domain-containing protein n=1 Tax=Cellulomonas sp. Root137 TaxID=1736459 RepID=UPI00138EF6C0|nr:phospholipase D-like domain-containing protein [Cellulomonas sp. Root137]
MAADEFLARDAYNAWVRLVERAELTVWVLTPYLDDQVVRLLTKSRVPASQVTVVTDLSPESGPANYRKRLLALKKLVVAGFQVRTLARLHAKVLAVDGSRFAIGSQNFTGYARRSREATVAPHEPVVDEKFRNRIREWVEAAEAVTEDDLDRLLEQLSDQMDLVDSAVAGLVAYFEAADQVRHERLSAEREAELQRARARARATEKRRREVERAQREQQITDLLARRVRSSPYRHHRGAAYGRLVDVWDQGGYFKVDSGESLTAWFGADGRSIDLTRLKFIPMILSPTGKLALVRVAQGQMSYATQNVSFGTRVSVGGVPLHLQIRFPDPVTTEGVNVIAILREHAWSPSTTLHMMFDLETLDLRRIEQEDRVWTSPIEQFDTDELRDVALQIVDDEVEREAFLKRVFQGTALTGFKSSGRTIGSFLDEGRYKVDLLEVAGGLFLTARPG